MSGHPSRLALDRLALGVEDAATRAHADGCADCAAHLHAVRVELPIPQWVKDFPGKPAAAAWWRPVFIFAAMAAIAAVVLVSPGRVTDGGVTPKGTAAAQVWVNRSGKVAMWDGAPLQPGDALRFEVKAGAYTHLTVVELKDSKLFRVLHSAPISDDGLSPAWAVDAEGTRDEVAVLLSKAPLSEEELQRALAGGGGVWSTRWSFPKEIR